MRLTFRVNDEKKSVDVPPMKRLLDTLREDLGLPGTKEGCGEGECGACTVLVDGVAVNSCLVPSIQVEGREVTTIEGLAGTKKLHKLQRAFLECGGAQCGICTPGMILAASTLPKKPTLDEIKVGLAGNLCRCTGYTKIYEAVQVALGSDKDKGKKDKHKKKHKKKKHDNGEEKSDTDIAVAEEGIAEAEGAGAAESDAAPEPAPAEDVAVRHVETAPAPAPGEGGGAS